MYTQVYSCWPYVSKTSQKVYLDSIKLDENLYLAFKHINLAHI